MKIEYLGEFKQLSGHDQKEILNLIRLKSKLKEQDKIEQLKDKLKEIEEARKEAIEFINKELEEIGKHQYAVGIRRLNKIKNILDIDKGE